MRPVVFLGDFNVDIILDGLAGPPAPDREVGCASFDMVLGASCCIAAVAYGHLGGAGALCGLSGDDAFGDFMRARLAEAGIRSDLVGRHPEARTGVTVNLMQAGGRVQVTYAGAMGRFSAEDIDPAMFDGLGHLYVSGIYQADALRLGVGGLLSRARNAGATTSLDCQWDPSEKWQGLDEWLPHVSWLLVNVQEAASMTGRADPGEALEALAGRTPCPVIKAGPAGAWVLDDGRPLLVPARPVRVVDTIGAGDNFNAAFVFAVLEKGLPVVDAVKVANAAAGRSCTFRGGTDARSSWEDVMRFMETRG